MCIPHGMAATKPTTTIKDDKAKKSIKKPSKRMMEKGDPDFVDERTQRDTSKKEEGFFSSLFGSW